MEVTLLWLFSLGFGHAGVFDNDVLVSGKVTLCSNDSVKGAMNVDVGGVYFEYTKPTGDLYLSFSSDSDRVQSVYGNLTVDFGLRVFTRIFYPCNIPGMEDICPVPAGSFSASGHIPIPEQYTAIVPSNITVTMSLLSVPYNSSEAESSATLVCVSATLRASKGLTEADEAGIGFSVPAAALLLAPLAIWWSVRRQRARKAEEERSADSKAELPPCGVVEISGVERPAEVDSTVRHELESDRHGCEASVVR